MGTDGEERRLVTAASAVSTERVAEVRRGQHIVVSESHEQQTAVTPLPVWRLLQADTTTSADVVWSTWWESEQ